MPTYQDLVYKSLPTGKKEVWIKDLSRGFKDPTELAGYLGMDAKNLDWTKIADYQAPTAVPPSNVQPVQPIQPIQPNQPYNPPVLDIYNARPDVQKDLETRYPGQNATVQGTEANTALNDWYNQYGKFEGADMVTKGILTPPNEQTGTPSGNTPINATGSATGQNTSISSGTDDITAKFQQYTEQMAKNQTDSQAKIEQLMSKMGEDTTNATLAKFQEMQKGLSDSYNTYFTEQTKYFDELKNQPSAVENLQKFREQQGLPQMEAQLANVDKTILDTEGLLANIEADVRKRTEGLPVSEAAARRLTAMEQKPLTKQMDELLRSRARVAAGLQAKQQNVTDFMNAQTEDLNKQKELAEAKLGISKEAFGFKKDIATQGFEMFTGLQDNLNKINEIRLTQAVSDKDYKNQLASAGFDFYSQMRAEKIAKENANTTFENELTKIRLENELKKANPELDIKLFEDANKNVTQVSTNPITGKSEVINLGQIGSGALAETIRANKAQEAIQWTNAQTNASKSEILSITDAEKLGVPYGTTKEQAAAMGKVPGSTNQDIIQTTGKIQFLKDTIENAKKYVGASGRSGVRRGIEGALSGATDFTNLVAYTDTLRTNALTLFSDPNIKKFFGPQMSNADVRLMTSAGTSMNAESLYPENMKQQIEDYEELIIKMEKSLPKNQLNGTNENLPQTMILNGQTLNLQSDGTYK